MMKCWRSVPALTLGNSIPRYCAAHIEVPLMSSPLKVSDSSFQNDVISSKKPVVVDFWAEWCGPCKMIAPALEELAGELADRVTIAKINIDENPHIPQKY